MSLNIKTTQPLVGINAIKNANVGTKPIAFGHIPDSANLVSEFDKYLTQSAIYRMVTSNPRVMTILNELNIPLHIHMNTLSNLKGHLKKTRDVAVGMVQYLPKEMKEKINVQHLSQAAILHDIGKCLIPPRIINKPVRLSPHEKNIMDLHPILSYELLKTTDLDRNVAKIAGYHHQNLNGTGYPKVGKDFVCHPHIELISAADNYSALTEKRSYKLSKTKEEALAIIKSEHLDTGKLSPTVYHALVDYVNAESLTKVDKQGEPFYAKLINRLCSKFFKAHKFAASDIMG